jgi:cytidylate kinase
MCAMNTLNFRKTDFIPDATPQDESTKAHIVIAVDGPAASGKGTLARKLAERLGYAWLDTGALYRAVALATLEMGGDPTNAADVMPAVSIVKRNLTPELLANPALRTPDVSSASSKVAAIPEVRLELLDFQRNFAANPPGKTGGAVLDGRDIGTVVCPNADIKFFITASVDERARRRFAEVQASNPDATYITILEDLIARDERDSTRKVAPTRAADDAYVIDTSKLNVPQVLEEAIAVIRSKFLDKTNDNATTA